MSFFNLFLKTKKRSNFKVKYTVIYEGKEQDTHYFDSNDSIQSVVRKIRTIVSKLDEEKKK